MTDFRAILAAKTARRRQLRRGGRSRPSRFLHRAARRKRVRRRLKGNVPFLIALLALVSLLTGCSTVPKIDIASGEFGRAREIIREKLPADREDRDYLLARMSLGILDLADGQPKAAEPVLDETFDVLRTQGINADKTVASIVLTEGVRFWKGEPFEQALAFHYVAVQKAMLGEWDNARAASNSSLFLLKDFGENETGSAYSTLEIAQNAEKWDQEGKGDYLDKGYQPVRTDFALGYLMAAVSNRAMGREDEANDNFARAVQVDAGLKPLVERLRGNAYNTVLVVDAGRGPEKIQTGPYGALSRFQPLWNSDRQGLAALVSTGQAEVWPVVCDINAMSQDHKWNNMEDVRTAKGHIGAALIGAGAIVATSGDDDNNRSGRAATGLALAAGGLLLMATAGADTRQCDYLPQRIYLVPILIDRPDTWVRIDSAGIGGTVSLVMPGLHPPAKGSPIQLRYVRMPLSAQVWASSGKVVYANDRVSDQVEGDGLPYILGGTCVCTPSEESLSRYKAAGHLTDFTLNDLRNLYREEGIAIEPTDPGYGGRHLLEGGVSLACPVEGSAGFSRLFCQPHPAYRPKSEQAATLAEQLGAGSVQSTSTARRPARSRLGGLFGKEDR
jgi:hypothetical protein